MCFLPYKISNLIENIWTMQNQKFQIQKSRYFRTYLKKRRCQISSLWNLFGLLNSVKAFERYRMLNMTVSTISVNSLVLLKKNYLSFFCNLVYFWKALKCHSLEIYCMCIFIYGWLWLSNKSLIENTSAYYII